MNRLMKSAALTVATAAALLPAIEASAGERWAQQRPRHPAAHHRIDRTGELVAAGVIGLALGAIAVGALNAANQPEPVHVDPEPRFNGHYGHYGQGGYRVHQGQGYRNYGHGEGGGYRMRRHAEPQVIYAEGALAGAEPWSAEWYAWCDQRYRSFNAQTGTYRGYDGRDHFCVAQ